MAQFGSILRSFGIRYGYYNPTNFQECRYIDPIVETFADVMSALTKLMFNPPGEDATPLIESYVSVAKKYHGLME